MSLSLGIGLGLTMQRGGGVAPGILEYRSHTHTDVDNTDPSVPVDVEAGDFLIAMGFTSDNAAITLATPSGWTAVAGQDSDFICGVNVVAKRADGTETGDVSVFASRAADSGIVLCLKGGLSSLGSIVDVDAEADNTNPAAQVKNASTLGVLPFVVFGFYSSDGNVTTRTFTGDTEDAEKGATEAWVKWKFYGVNDTPSDITIDQGDFGDNGLVSAIIEVVF